MIREMGSGKDAIGFNNETVVLAFQAECEWSVTWLNCNGIVLVNSLCGIHTATKKAIVDF